MTRAGLSDIEPATSSRIFLLKIEAYTHRTAHGNF
jgi:hypothetical protein